MADIAASVLARLKNKATESGRSYQLCLQLFCQYNFSTVLKTIKAFLTKPFTSAVEGKEFTEKWSAANGEWM